MFYSEVTPIGLHQTLLCSLKNTKPRKRSMLLRETLNSNNWKTRTCNGYSTDDKMSFYQNLTVIFTDHRL